VERRPDLGELVAIMDRLRGPAGCPWDREQDYGTLRGYLLEECYEVAEALDLDDGPGLCEELGDLLFQIVFLARIAKEQGRFDIDDVLAGIAAKMVRRHPHVFGDASAANSAEVLRHWEEIKRREKADGHGARSTLDGIPAALPALVKAQRLGTKAARVGFDWTRPEDVLEKFDEELGEVREALAAGNRAALHEELGDLLFTVAMLARRLDVDAERALQDANRKFATRFGRVEAQLAQRAGGLAGADAALLERLWNEAKDQTT